MGIGFYSIPKLRRVNPFALRTAWVCWALWVAGVSLRWATMVYQWQWKTLLPVSAALELIAFLFFFHAVSGHRPQAAGPQKPDHWVVAVMAASIGLLVTLVVNFGGTLFLAYRGGSPDLPPQFEQRFLVLETWGFLVPFVWGFSAKWLPIFLGLRPVRGRVLLLAVAVNCAGVLAAMTGWVKPSAFLSMAAVIAAVYALRFFEPAQRPAKVLGVHSSFPFLVRVAYFWAMVAASLGIWAAAVEDSRGIWGASRHALTVGFLATMVFSIGQRVLPAFIGMRLLFSPRLMFISLLLLNVGCLLRIGSEILAYQGFARWAWSWLPVSAVTEMTAVTVFAANLLLTFVHRSTSQEV